MAPQIKNKINEIEVGLKDDGKLSVMSVEDTIKISNFINHRMERFRRSFQTNQNKSKAAASMKVLNT